MLVTTCNSPLCQGAHKRWHGRRQIPVSSRVLLGGQSKREDNFKKVREKERNERTGKGSTSRDNVPDTGPRNGSHGIWQENNGTVISVALAARSTHHAFIPSVLGADGLLLSLWSRSVRAVSRITHVWAGAGGHKVWSPASM